MWGFRQKRTANQILSPNPFLFKRRSVGLWTGRVVEGIRRIVHPCTGCHYKLKMKGLLILTYAPEVVHIGERYAILGCDQ